MMFNSCKCFFNLNSKKEFQKILKNSFSSKYEIFDRKLKLKQREYTLKHPNHNIYDYLKEENGYRIFDRILDINREFETLVELNCGKGFIAEHLDNELVKNIILCDSSEKMLEITKTPKDISWKKVIVDEENISFEENSIDILVSNLSLHWVNQLPDTLKKINFCLKNDGVLLGSIFGGQTLFELRCSLQLAEIERQGGFSPHISPFVEPADIGSLLQASGFNMPTIDCTQVIINYPSMFELIDDLQGMGESNCGYNRKTHIHRSSLLAAASIYKEMYQNKDGSVPATFQIFNFIGWKPDKSQPKPLERGSGKFSLKDIGNLETFITENKKGNKT